MPGGGCATPHRPHPQVGCAGQYVLNILEIVDQATAGELARRTGLTTGAITKLIDRLERTGLVERKQDASDRRRVLVSIVSAAADVALGGESAELFAPVARRLDALLADFTPTQRDTLFEYFARATDELTRATQEVHERARARRRSWRSSR